ncbi:MAG: HAD-IB family hydrolase, partial [Chthoniobacterales bacterium]
QNIESQRKKFWKLASAFGWKNLLALLRRRLSIEEALTRAGKVLGCPVAPIILDNPEASIDVDKVSDLFAAEEILKKRKALSTLTTTTPSPGKNIAIFDLDRTITRHGTYTYFLLSLQDSRLKKITLLLRILPQVLRYKRGKITRLTLKERMLVLAIAGKTKEQILLGAKKFTIKILKTDLRHEALKRIVKHRNQGDHLILATASIDLYARIFASKLGFDQLLATTTHFAARGTQALYITGKNCYGSEKLHRIQEVLQSPPTTDRDKLTITFYSDDASDLPLLTWADEGIVISPKNKTRHLAKKQKLKIEDW